MPGQKFARAGLSSLQLENSGASARPA